MENKPKIATGILADFCLFILLIYFIDFTLNESPLTELSTDEGVNSIKAYLHYKGFSFYDQIWSDQPPLFTWILAKWYSIGSVTLSSSRMVVHFFSALLALSLFKLVKLSRGWVYGLVTVTFLLISKDYLLCSNTLLIGVPSLCFAVLSLYVLSLYEKNNSYRYLIVSALFMAMAVNTKMFVLSIIPAIVIGMLIMHWPKQKITSKLLISNLRMLFYWLAVFFVGSITILYILAPAALTGDLFQLITPHSRLAESVSGANWHEIQKFISNDYDLIFLAEFGVWMMWRRNNFDFIIPLVWLVSSTVILLYHNPIWHHHYLLISIPLVWLAGLAVAELNLTRLKKMAAMDIPAVCFITVAIVIGVMNFSHRIDDINSRFLWRSKKLNTTLIQEMGKYASSTNWVATDRPAYPFTLKLFVPPEIAVITQKRHKSGMFNSDYFLEIVEKYQPEQVLFARFKFLADECKGRIGENYQVAAENYQVAADSNTFILYIRNDIYNVLNL